MNKPEMLAHELADQPDQLHQDEARDADMLDVATWAEEYMATKEPLTQTYSPEVEEAGRRNGFAPFAYEERS